MDRRSFLKSVFALGTSTIAPFDVAPASEAQLDHAWAALRNAPAVFYANEWGTLSALPYPDIPCTRQELYGNPQLLTREDVAALMGRNFSVCDALTTHCFPLVDEERWAGHDWDEWVLATNDERFARVLAVLRKWLNGEPDELDYESAARSGLTGQGAAFSFFYYLDPQIARPLHIVIVEGDRPGSSYFAAELRMGVDEADAVARVKGIPLRFAHGDF